jgi:hypothetical protein
MCTVPDCPWPEPAVLEVDGEPRCTRYHAQGVQAWGVGGRKGVFYGAGITVPTGFTSGTWAQNQFSAANTYDLMGGIDLGGIRGYVGLRETGATMRTSAGRQAVATALRAAVDMYAAQLGRARTATETWYRRTV